MIYVCIHETAPSIRRTLSRRHQTTASTLLPAETIMPRVVRARRKVTVIVGPGDVPDYQSGITPLCQLGHQGSANSFPSCAVAMSSSADKITSSRLPTRDPPANTRYSPSVPHHRSVKRTQNHQPYPNFCPSPPSLQRPAPSETSSKYAQLSPLP